MTKKIKEFIELDGARFHWSEVQEVTEASGSTLIILNSEERPIHTMILTDLSVAAVLFMIAEAQNG